MKLKICMLLPIGWGPNMRVDPQIGIASYLVNFGHEVTWIVSEETNENTQQVAPNGIRIYTAPYIHYLSEKSLPSKAFNLVLAMFRKARLTLKVFREREYDLVFVRDDTLDGLLGTFIKRRHKTLLVYELVDPLNQECEGYKIEARKPVFLWYLMAKIKALLKIYTIKRADLVLPTTRWFEGELVERGISQAKLIPFPNGVEIETFRSKNQSDIRRKYRLEKSKVIIYLGVIGKVRKLEILIQAFSIVRETREDVKLLMVGDGTGREDIEKLAAELELRDDVIFTGRVRQSEVPNFIAATDIGVSPVPPFSFYKVSSPIKMLEYMAMGKPVVANEEIHEHEEIINQSGGGILVPFTPEAFACAIIELLDNPEMAEEMGRRCHDWVIKNRTFDILARRLEKQYFQLINHSET